MKTLIDIMLTAADTVAYVGAVMALSLVTAIGICAILAIIDSFGRGDE